METFDMTKTVKTMMEAPSCCAELKAAALAWLNAKTPEEKRIAGEKLEHEIQEDVATLDEALAFYESPMALQIFGAELRKEKTANAKARKAAGEKWCDCPACAAAIAILDHPEFLFR